MTVLRRPANQDPGRGWIPGQHRGIDYGWGSGTQILAAADGFVESVYGGGGYNGGWGNRIIIRHNARCTTTYNHIATGTINVSVGQPVTAGQHIASMGDTGEAQGVHLHFELYVDGERVDPAPYFTQDLPGSDPVPPGAVRKTNRADGAANVRTGPGTAYSVAAQIAAGDYADFNAWTRGESVDGNDVWLRGAYSGNWAWAGSFTNTTPEGLPEIATSTPQPAPPTVPSRPAYKAAPVDTLQMPTAADFPGWIAFDVALDSDEVGDILAKNEADWTYYFDKYGQDRAYWPEESCVHWWGDPTAGATHDGIVDYLRRTKDLSADFVTSAGRITMTGDLRTASYTTGPRAMYQWTSENDPALTDDGYLTIAVLHYVMERLNPHLRGEAIRLHKEFAATACSPIDTARLRTLIDEFHDGRRDFATGELVAEPEPEPPAVPEPTPEPAEPDPAPEPEEPTMPDVDPSKPTISPAHAKGAMAALRNILNPTARMVIYVTFGLAGIAIGTWQTWLVSTAQLAPWYFNGVVAVYAFWGTFIAILAAPNTTKD